MVVAARTGNGKPQKGLGRRINLLIDDVVKHFHIILLCQRLGSQRQESGGDDASLVDFLSVLCGEQIPGDRFPDEAAVFRVTIYEDGPGVA